MQNNKHLMKKNDKHNFANIADRTKKDGNILHIDELVENSEPFSI